MIVEVGVVALGQNSTGTSLGSQLSQTQRRVLILRTCPAHPKSLPVRHMGTSSFERSTDRAPALQVPRYPQNFHTDPSKADAILPPESSPFQLLFLLYFTSGLNIESTVTPPAPPISLTFANNLGAVICRSLIDLRSLSRRRPNSVPPPK
ncbi:hypothetical protein BD311DRAFT_124173 [Dichomitus squalens]|uniref:Uncharacterized protein n=1 Tax=Dichomitus squalens TaxID=114155 RepID=A0A4Q9M9I4_9APHY|nr:hypothetical protein BD311DRAFT_124173 [Dichomitus squalens]